MEELQAVIARRAFRRNQFRELSYDLLQMDDQEFDNLVVFLRAQREEWKRIHEKSLKQQLRESLNKEQ